MERIGISLRVLYFCYPCKNGMNIIYIEAVYKNKHSIITINWYFLWKFLVLFPRDSIHWPVRASENNYHFVTFANKKVFNCIKINISRSNVQGCIMWIVWVANIDYTTDVALLLPVFRSFEKGAKQQDTIMPMFFSFLKWLWEKLTRTAA